MKTILIADDEIDIAEMLQLFLESEGYNAIAAFDGVQALLRAIEVRPDLVLTDLMMPRMDGEELIQEIRATPHIGDTPIIAMSGKPRADLDVAFFRKPFDPFELLGEIRRQIGDDA